jgi:hypothetical protein
MNLDVDAARIKRRIQISELEEMRLKDYGSATIYEERMKQLYDKPCGGCQRFEST